MLQLYAKKRSDELSVKIGQGNTRQLVEDRLIHLGKEIREPVLYLRTDHALLVRIIFVQRQHVFSILMIRQKNVRKVDLIRRSRQAHTARLPFLAFHQSALLQLDHLLAHHRRIHIDAGRNKLRGQVLALKLSEQSHNVHTNGETASFHNVTKIVTESVRVKFGE